MELSREEKAIIALKKIARPIDYLQDEATKAGGKLDGRMAMQLANDADWLKSIAKSALIELESGTIKAEDVKNG